MESQKSGARTERATTTHGTYCSLLLQAARVLRMRYVECRRDTSLSPAVANELAEVFEGVAKGDSAFDQIDPNEAIALAHRLIDDDHPELSRMWPRTT
ncbi:hypothetical protein [Prauserella muralis]|uniref:Uncharacterized protein n=1 Tax=Prauserella muralis TaxID=588067 RepID=A0A2V4AFY1_9PSEU|nr:hypothetical protein [Prauserella muralis]PXY18858.1 hypothetical protein BAY60_28835 [Prauserella muralis]TWE28715.1 hypothetical protein FHX69_1374 [Prauserella muralis]